MVFAVTTFPPSAVQSSAVATLLVSVFPCFVVTSHFTWFFDPATTALGAATNAASAGAEASASQRRCFVAISELLSPGRGIDRNSKQNACRGRGARGSARLPFYHVTGNFSR